MRLGEMTKKHALKPSYNSDKSVAICEFVNIQCSNCGVGDSIAILFKALRHIVPRIDITLRFWIPACYEASKNYVF